MKPYRVAEDTSEFITYEFRTVYMYILYVVLAVMLIGFWTDNTWLSLVGGGLMAVYIIFVSIPCIPLHRKIRKAMREGSVEFSGSKWSFAKPLKMKMRKIVPTKDSTLSTEGAPSVEK